MVTTGSSDLDEFLGGYFGLTMIYGACATGKTTLGELATAKLIKSGKKVIYVDTEKGFSMERLKQIDEKAVENLHNLFLLHPNSFEEQHKYILNLTKNVDLIIVDTIGHFYRLELKNDAYQTNKLMDQQLTKLSEISKEVPVVMLNQVYSHFDHGIMNVGGEMFKKRSTQIILLEKEPRNLICEKPKEKNLMFEITNEGVCKK